MKLCEYLSEERKEFVLSRKALESGTAIGVLVEEVRQGEDRTDFRSKLSMANKEAFKTKFLAEAPAGQQLYQRETSGIAVKDCEELQKMLIASLKSTPTSS